MKLTNKPITTMDAMGKAMERIQLYLSAWEDKKKTPQQKLKEQFEKDLQRLRNKKYKINREIKALRKQYEMDKIVENI